MPRDPVDAPTGHAHRLADGRARRGIERHEPCLERDERQPTQAARDQVEVRGQPGDAIGEDLPGGGVLESISRRPRPTVPRCPRRGAPGGRPPCRPGHRNRGSTVGRARLPRAPRGRSHRRGRGHPPRRFPRRRRETRRRSRRCASASRSCCPSKRSAASRHRGGRSRRGCRAAVRSPFPSASLSRARAR